MKEKKSRYLSIPCKVKNLNIEEGSILKFINTGNISPEDLEQLSRALLTEGLHRRMTEDELANLNPTIHDQNVRRDIFEWNERGYGDYKRAFNQYNK